MEDATPVDLLSTRIAKTSPTACRPIPRCARITPDPDINSDMSALSMLWHKLLWSSQAPAPPDVLGVAAALRASSICGNLTKLLSFAVPHAADDATLYVPLLQVGQHVRVLACVVHGAPVVSLPGWCASIDGAGADGIKEAWHRTETEAAAPGTDVRLYPVQGELGRTSLFQPSRDLKLTIPRSTVHSAETGFPVVTVPWAPRSASFRTRSVHHH